MSRRWLAAVLGITVLIFVTGTTPGLGEESSTAIVHWSFDSVPEGEVVGKVELTDEGPSSSRFPDFDADNRALQIPLGSFLRLPDDGGLDFDNGDAITVTAWVKLDSLENHAYVIGKGRSAATGPQSTNQNWAVRLRKRDGQACVNFLFRSRSDGEHEGDWHRWTSLRGFPIHSGWHQLAVRYRFGDPSSIAGFLDGRPVKGTWDMGGPTNRAPVVDDDDVWIGSAMEGNRGNSFHGVMDELMVYRAELSDEVLTRGFHYDPPVIVPPKIPAGSVVMQLFGPYSAFDLFADAETHTARLTWRQDALALTRLPNRYDDWGVRDDWTKPDSGTMMVRAWSEVDLEPGEYQFLFRSRGLSRLFVDGEPLAETGPQRNRTGAHHVVDPLPEVAVEGMRPHFMNDHERIVSFTSAGGRHRVRFETNVGATKFALRVGETCVAVARAGQMFEILSPKYEFPLTDEGWQACASEVARQLDQLDTDNRRSAAAKQNAYWQQRHAQLRTRFGISEPVSDAAPAAKSIDRLIHERIEQNNQQAAGSPEWTENGSLYRNTVEPILARHCGRCHTDKQEGGIRIDERASLLNGGDSEEAAVTPGSPATSLLYELITASPDDQRMPPEGPGLDTDEVAAISKWIAGGAEMPAVKKTPIHVPDRISDLAFLRRAYLDTVGVVPTLAEVEMYLDDPPEARRQPLIDRLMEDPRWADNWVGYWQDVLAENPNLLKPMLNNTGPFRYWIHDALSDNKPLDRFATELIMMRGSKWYGGAAGFGFASQNDAPMAAKAHVIGNAFLGVELKCARCHDAPYHDWTQRDLFELAAMLERKPIELPASSTVPTAFFDHSTRKPLISASLTDGTTIEPRWPLAAICQSIDDNMLQNPDDSRERLAAQITTSRRFAEVIANRIWARLMGEGIVAPVHDWNGNPPSDPQLLEFLADHLIHVGFDQKRFVRAILLSDVYQRQAIDPEPGRFFAGPVRRRMSAEQIVDSALVAVGQTMATEMLTLDLEGTHKPDWFFNFGYPRRAWEFTTLANERDRPSLALPRAQAVADVLQAFGWRDARPEPLSQREMAPNLIQPGVLANGTFGTWLTRLTDDSELTNLMLREDALEALVEKLFLCILTRPPSLEERAEFTALLTPGFESRRIPADQVAPKTPQRRFRYVSWSNHLNTEANSIKTEMEAVAKQGSPPTRRLDDAWRRRAEDAVWALLNSPEMILVP